MVTRTTKINVSGQPTMVVQGKTCIRPVVQAAGAYPDLCNMPLDGKLVHHRVIPWFQIGCYPFIHLGGESHYES